MIIAKYLYVEKFKYLDERWIDYERITKEAIELLINYSWPGNIRELVNIVEYVSTIKENNIKIDVTYLPKYITESFNNTTLDE